MTQPLTASGVILAGGLSRRMGGSEKALQRLGDRPLIEHVAQRFAPQVAELFISANRQQASYAALGYRVLSDEIPDFAGPLAGIHAALAVSSHDYLVAVPCDAPFLPLDLVTRLCGALRESSSLMVVALSPGGVQPAFCACRRSVREELTRFLQAGGRRMQDFGAAVHAITVDFPDANAFANINTLAELEAAQNQGTHS